MTTAQLSHGEDVGSLTYEEREDGTVEFSVTYPDKKIRRAISQYLGNTEREYRTPQSSNVHDDDFIESGKPIDNIDFFERALSEIYGRLGVWLKW